MKKFLSTLLVFSTLINCSTPSSALNAQIKGGKQSNCEVHIDKYRLPESSNDMKFMILGSIELTATPEEIIRNSKYLVKVKEEPKYRCFNIFKPSKFLKVLPVREDVNKFKLDGVEKETYWFNFPGKLMNLIFGDKVSVEYVLVPLNSTEMKAFKEKKVTEGELKPETKANKALLKKIKESSKDDDYAYIYEDVIKKLRKGLESGDLDAFDPYNVGEKGSLSAYEDGEIQHNKKLLSSSYAYTKKEADAKNKQISADRIKVYNDLMYEHGTDFKQCGDVAELTEKNPSKYFLIVVKEKEAYKLRKLIEKHGKDFIFKDKSTIEFNILQKFESVPADAEIDEETRDEIIKEVNSTIAKPGPIQLFKNLGSICYAGLEKVLPKIVTDFLRAGALTVCDGWDFVKEKINTTAQPKEQLQPPEQPQQQVGGNNNQPQQPEQPQPQGEDNNNQTQPIKFKRGDGNGDINIYFNGVYNGGGQQQQPQQPQPQQQGGGQPQQPQQQGGADQGGNGGGNNGN